MVKIEVRHVRTFSILELDETEFSVISEAIKFWLKHNSPTEPEYQTTQRLLSEMNKNRNLADLAERSLNA